MPQTAIHFATIHAGGGHVATARAMMEAVEQHYPGRFALGMSDLMLELGLAQQDRRHKELWKWMLARPWTARWGQRLMDRLPKAVNLWHRQMLDETAKRAARRFAAEKPALVVVNHPWLMVALTRSQRRYGLRTRVLTFATEPLDASALWAEREAEHVVAPSRAAMRDLVRMGVNPGGIDVVGYPVAQRFLRPPGQTEAREALGLDARFTVLVSLGGEGVASGAETVVRAALEALPQAQLVVLAGRNAALHARLQALAAPPRLRVEGFSERVADWLAAADVVVGKAGPASVFEALAVGRPVLVTSYAGMNEAKIVRFLEAKGLGAYAPRAAALKAKLNELEDETARHNVTARCRALGLPQMSEELAHYLAAYSAIGAPATRLREGLA